MNSVCCNIFSCLSNEIGSVQFVCLLLIRVSVIKIYAESGNFLHPTGFFPFVQFFSTHYYKVNCFSINGKIGDGQGGNYALYIRTIGSTARRYRTGTDGFEVTDGKNVFERHIVAYKRKGAGYPGNSEE